MPPSDSDVWDTTFRNVFRIADGLTRDEISRRAQQAYDRANDYRATRQSGATEAVKRLDALTQAVGWQNVVIYLNRTRRAVFLNAEYQEWTRQPLMRLRSRLSVVLPGKWRMMIVLAYGAKPYAFRGLK